MPQTLVYTIVNRHIYRRRTTTPNYNYNKRRRMMTTTTTTTTTTTADPLSPTSPTNTCWPWMKEAKCRLHNPIALLDEFDHRPAVQDLLEKHSAEITRLRTKLQHDPLFVPEKHDELWMLRFLLSHRGHFDAAYKAAVSTLAFRQDHGLDDWDLRGIPVQSNVLLAMEESDSSDTDNNNSYKVLPPFARAAGKMLACYENDTTLLYSIPDVQRGVIGYLQLAHRNQHKMAATLLPEDYFEAHLFFTEYKFQWTDYLTRTTGRLTKYMSIADCTGVHQRMIHKESKKMDSQAAKQMENHYPQLLGSMMVVAAPKWLNIVFVIIKPFLPKRLLEKVDLIKPTHKKKDLHKLLAYCSLEDLPTRYGGTCDTWPPAPPPTTTTATALTSFQK